MLERRKGGETGVAEVRYLEGDAVRIHNYSVDETRHFQFTHPWLLVVEVDLVSIARSCQTSLRTANGKWHWWTMSFVERVCCAVQVWASRDKGEWSAELMETARSFTTTRPIPLEDVTGVGTCSSKYSH